MQFLVPFFMRNLNKKRTFFIIQLKKFIKEKNSETSNEWDV